MMAYSVVRRKTCSVLAISCSSPPTTRINRCITRLIGSHRALQPEFYEHSWRNATTASNHWTPSLVGKAQDSTSDDRKEHQKRLRDALPRINVANRTPTNILSAHSSGPGWQVATDRILGQHRGLSTTTTTTAKPPATSTGSHQVHSASLSSNSSSQQEPGSDENEMEKQHTWRQRAEDIRDNARESLQEFREHPGESMKSGAKTFSGMMRIYGPVFFGCHVAVYFATLGGLFVGVDSGLLDPAYLMSVIGNGAAEGAAETKNTVDYVVEWMRSHSWSSGMAPFIERNPHFASLAVAWIAVKFTEPMRLPVSLFLTPRVARYLGRQPTNPDVEEDGNTSVANDNDTVNKGVEKDKP